MATTNHERVGKALELLRDGLGPFIQREFKAQHGQYWVTTVTAGWRDEAPWPEDADAPRLDVALLLRLMWEQWNETFRSTLGHAERSLVSELREHRNRWAHQEPFSTDDAYRALDSAGRLLIAVSARESDEIDTMKMELLRLRFDEQARTERRRTARTAIESQVTGTLTPWREVVTPHPDVASGRYQQAEFAADLWQVHMGEGSDEYRNPTEFFRRTYLTEGLKRLLTGAILRLSGQGGDPVVQLQTNFGGGKTHSMLALYHLFSGTPPTEMAGVEVVLKDAGATRLPKVIPVVLVGTKISPGSPVVKADGTVVRTLWGELAWQLGLAAGGVQEAKRAFDRVRADDELATSPGDVLRELMDQYAPCLILIDEWVAYARQLHDTADLPGGKFGTHFTFVQALTEAAKAAKQCLLVVSLPASDTRVSPHSQAEDVEVGGERGRAALDGLSNLVGRLEDCWRPATAEESFEIVRRRLFEPIIDPQHFVDRDNVARAFFDLYRTQPAEFPPDSSEADYEKRLKAAYPIHPEVFDRLYTDWSTLVKFQRTRGVLRLMAAVIHSLWVQVDRNPLIMPANIPIDDPRVRDELTRYLSDNWVPVIEKDVDGPNALPLRLDLEVPNLGKYAASRRVARTIYLGSAPTMTAANPGLEDRGIKLGCVMPGESPAIFGDALRRLSSAATYLYQYEARYWYSTQPTVTKLAEDRAEQYKREPEWVAEECARRLRENLRTKGDFSRIHTLPGSSQDVLDDPEARLVVLSTEHPFSREPNNPAEMAAKKFLAWRGSTPRTYANSLVFLAADKNRLQDLDEALRRYLAWEQICSGKEQSNLSMQQLDQAVSQKDAADSVVTARLPETYQWLLAPAQETPKAAVVMQSHRLTGSEALAVRASKKLRNDELLLTSMAGTRLRMDLDKVLWRGNPDVAIKQLAEDFGRYVYLPRLKDTSVLFRAVEDGVGLMLWRQDGFALADSFDAAAQRYRGLRAGQRFPITEGNMSALLVRPEVADKQMLEEVPAPSGPGPVPVGPQPQQVSGGPAGPKLPLLPSAPVPPKRFHGTVTLDSARVGRDAGRIAEEIIAHLTVLSGSKVKVTLDIEAEIPAGAPDQVVRTVIENSRTLKFTSQGFEKE